MTAAGIYAGGLPDVPVIFSIQQADRWSSRDISVSVMPTLDLNHCCSSSSKVIRAMGIPQICQASKVMFQIAFPAHVEGFMTVQPLQPRFFIRWQRCFHFSTSTGLVVRSCFRRNVLSV